MRVHRVIAALNNAKPPPKAPNITPHFVDLIRKSAKFDLGRFGPADADAFKALRDTGHDIIANGLYAPPYPLTYVELLIDDDGTSIYTGVLTATAKWFSSMPGLPPEMVAFLLENPDNAHHFLILGNSPGDVESYGVGVYRYEVSKDGVYTGAPMNNEPLDQESFNKHASAVAVILELLSGLLTTRKAEVVYHPVAEKLNRARLKRGVEPTYAHHTIKIGGVSTTGRVLGIGATHASPRKHWRRGHVRVLHRDTSKEKKKLIPACLINGRGFISKEYSA